MKGVLLYMEYHIGKLCITIIPNPHQPTSYGVHFSTSTTRKKDLLAFYVQQDTEGSYLYQNPVTVETAEDYDFNEEDVITVGDKTKNLARHLIQTEAVSFLEKNYKEILNNLTPQGFKSTDVKYDSPWLRVYKDYHEERDSLKDRIEAYYRAEGLGTKYKTVSLSTELQLDKVNLSQLRDYYLAESALVFAKLVITAHQMKNHLVEMSRIYSPDHEFLVASLRNLSYFGVGEFQESARYSGVLTVYSPDISVEETVKERLKAIRVMTRQTPCGYLLAKGHEYGNIVITKDNLLDFYRL